MSDCKQDEWRFRIPTLRMLKTWIHCKRSGIWVSWHENNYPYAKGGPFWVLYRNGEPFGLAQHIRAIGKGDAA